MNWLIIAAGGNGERMQLRFNKVFAKIGQKPILYWTLKQFEESAVIDKMIISIRESDMAETYTLIKKYQLKKITRIIKADNSRQVSTFSVLKQMRGRIKSNDLVGIHNAVNPFVTSGEIKAVFQQALSHQAALLARPATDTVKITNGERLVHHTPLREKTWYAQTPQVAIFKYLWQAFKKAEQDDFWGTDDTQLLEKIGVKAKIVPCSHLNIKITFPEDLMLAERILKNFQP